MAFRRATVERGAIERELLGLAETAVTPPHSRTGAVFMAAQDGSLAAIASVGQRFVVLTETPPTGSGVLPLPGGRLARDARQLVEHDGP